MDKKQINVSGNIGLLAYPLPEEIGEFEDAQNGYKYKRALQEISDEIRKNYKYGTDDNVPKTWYELKDWFYEMLKNSNCPDIW